MIARVSISAAAVGLVIAAAPHVPVLVWNASASAPCGFYAGQARERFGKGDLVLAHLPIVARHLASMRDYLPWGVPVVKRIAAVSGDWICARGLTISINGRAVAQRRNVDGRGRLLPTWQGCIRLDADHLFLLMAGVRDSFDGRYFGPIRRSAIIEKLTPLWTW